MKAKWMIKFKTDKDAIIDIQRSGGELCILTAYKRSGQPCKMELEKPENHPENYTYADVDLPSWWDGRPIKGYAWEDANNKHSVWCWAISNSCLQKYYCRSSIQKNAAYSTWQHFEPITESETTFALIKTKDGVKREIELTAEQVEALGL